MWKDYSTGYMKHNRASGISIVAAALIAPLFLSLLCSLFYNFWQDEIQGIILEEGDWQGRITGELDEADLTVIRNFSNVEQAVKNEALSKEQNMTVDIIFKKPGTIYTDMPLIVQKLGLPEDAAVCHELLLSRFLIHDPKDEEPPLLMSFYLAVLMIVSISLILIIHNSFAVSMHARLRQFGILLSVGATPGQILACLMQEAAALCAIPVLLGSLLGIALCYGVICGANRLVPKLPGTHAVSFRYHPAVFAVTLTISVLTVLVSAWIPARKLGKMTPLEAIRNTGELQLSRKKRFSPLALLFGIEGEMAGAALKAQKRALRTSALSMTLSFLGFTVMLCFFTLSQISTNYTYFQRYQDVWDVMVTVKNTKLADFKWTEELHTLQGVKDCAVYQKAAGTCLIPKSDISDELRALGGPESVAGIFTDAADGFYRVQAPIVILDDESFLTYCAQIGAAARLDGTIVYNRIWDSMNSNFRYPDYVPYIQENQENVLFQNATKEGESVAIPVIAYAQDAPVLREEYDDYVLAEFVPLSLWKTVSEQIGGTEPDLYIRVLAIEGAALMELSELEGEAAGLLSGYETETENRIQEKLTNDEMILGYKVILGGLCGLLAVIGVANVFSNTLGFLRQGKREFARYMSVGMTPVQLRNVFFIEALVIAGKPILITLPLTAVLVSFMIRASYLDPREFWRQAPVLPVALFALMIFGFVSLAYCLGARKVLRCSLAEALRDDTMV